MAGFDETALKRLEELVTKSKASGKLPAPEALELKELKLLKSAAEIAKGRAEIAVARRKIEDREKYRVGGLAVTAGLNAWTDAELKGGFAMLYGLSDAVRAALAEHGKQAPGSDGPNFGALLMSLPHALDQAPADKGEGLSQTDLLSHADGPGGAQGDS
jgi:hypothetical protein